jgi:ribosomal protein S18 acetylase RimI-like enzyme
MGLRITKATDGDIQLIAGILTEATHYKLDHGDEAWGSEPFSDKEIQAMLAGGSVYVVYMGDDPVGTVSLKWEDDRIWGDQQPNAAYLHRLAIKDGLHGRHLGEKIIDWTLTEAAKNGRQFLRLDCEAKNTELCAYYEKQGFIRVRTRKIPNTSYEAALYERKI